MRWERRKVPQARTGTQTAESGSNNLPLLAWQDGWSRKKLPCLRRYLRDYFVEVHLYWWHVTFNNSE